MYRIPLYTYFFPTPVFIHIVPFERGNVHRKNSFTHLSLYTIPPEHEKQYPETTHSCNHTKCEPSAPTSYLLKSLETEDHEKDDPQEQDCGTIHEKV